MIVTGRIITNAWIAILLDGGEDYVPPVMALQHLAVPMYRDVRCVASIASDGNGRLPCRLFLA